LQGKRGSFPDYPDEKIVGTVYQQDIQTEFTGF
jgi:hypothetical protein